MLSLDVQVKAALTCIKLLTAVVGTAPVPLELSHRPSLVDSSTTFVPLGLEAVHVFVVVVLNSINLSHNLVPDLSHLVDLRKQVLVFNKFVVKFSVVVGRRVEHRHLKLFDC